MKGILGAVALQDHVIDTTREIYCENGQWHVGGRAIHDDSPHQWLNLGGIIEVSSNIGAAKIALALGSQRFYQGLAAFGLGRKSGVDLPGEAAGLIRAPSTWRQIELADHGFGQGLAVTPIQLATAYAAIANGGIVMRPFVVRAAYDAGGREILRHTPQTLRRAVSPDVAHTMNQLLRGVVDGPEGTGRLARVADFTVAGKTGTAQMVNPATGTYYQSRLVASFVGFVPAEDPRMVILVVLYDVPHGHFGGLFAAPVFSEIAGDALAHLEVVPPAPSYETASLLPFGVSDNSDHHDDGAPESRSDSSVNAGFAPVSAASGIVPEFRGLSLRAALDLARSRRIDVEVSGSGYVVSQKPGPGAVLARPPAELTLMEKPEARSLTALTGKGSHQHRDHINRVRVNRAIVNRVRAAR
jgi:cell division protein FtsI (penicillin-binding protein 3)